MEKNWPYLTADIPPLALTARQTEEDFEVEEIPAYEPCGEGDHVYFRIEKKGISTHEACRRIAKVMNVPAKEIGAAGLKDARAVTRQWLSLEHADPARIQELQIPDLCVLTVTRHRNKLRIGHLKGNRFVLKLRGMEAARLPDFRTVLSRLQEKGVPNYFGAQRFGMRGDTALTGAALMREDYEAAARH
ncbi:MAG TPA: tRNA pseudouridine(13) synthase TruD, partial [Verrucomicrobiae bacterium]|nr:tRNA pseudouridine(13) synthase TruD [Verrucomicrobiae bacterium]